MNIDNYKICRDALKNTASILGFDNIELRDIVEYYNHLILKKNNVTIRVGKHESVDSKIDIINCEDYYQRLHMCFHSKDDTIYIFSKKDSTSIQIKDIDKEYIFNLNLIYNLPLTPENFIELKNIGTSFPLIHIRIIFE